MEWQPSTCMIKIKWRCHSLWAVLCAETCSMRILQGWLLDEFRWLLGGAVSAALLGAFAAAAWCNHANPAVCSPTRAAAAMLDAV